MLNREGLSMTHLLMFKRNQCFRSEELEKLRARTNFVEVNMTE